MEVRKLVIDDFYELRELLSTVFSKYRQEEIAFEKLFPRIFGTPNQYAVESHYGAFDDGKLIGTAAMYPIDYVVGGNHIRLIANGNVAVCEDYRGRGVMSAILTKINEECDKIADVCYLHGDPVRYGHFGYFPGETEYLLVFKPETKLQSGYKFYPMKENDVTILQTLSETKVEYVKRNSCDFIPALRSCYRKAISVFDNENKLIGYMSFDKDKKLVEEFAFYGNNEHIAFSEFANIISSPVKVLISGYDQEMYNRLKPYSTKISRQKEEPTLFRIVNSDRMQEIACKLGLEKNTLFAPYLT